MGENDTVLVRSEWGKTFIGVAGRRSGRPAKATVILVRKTERSFVASCKNMPGKLPRAKFSARIV